MDTKSTTLDGVYLLTPEVHYDDRGYFLEVIREEQLQELDSYFWGDQIVQWSQSFSRAGVVRGLHYQKHQGKLVRAIQGTAFDVILDLTSGKWESFILSASIPQSLWIPAGYAHGFCGHDGNPVEILYGTNEYYNPKLEGTIYWDDLDLKIPWPVNNPIVSEKDQNGILWKDA